MVVSLSARFRGNKDQRLLGKIGPLILRRWPEKVAELSQWTSLTLSISCLSCMPPSLPPNLPKSEWQSNTLRLKLTSEFRPCCISTASLRLITKSSLASWSNAVLSREHIRRQEFWKEKLSQCWETGNTRLHSRLLTRSRRDGTASIRDRSLVVIWPGWAVLEKETSSDCPKKMRKLAHRVEMPSFSWSKASRSTFLYLSISDKPVLRARMAQSVWC